MARRKGCSVSSDLRLGCCKYTPKRVDAPTFLCFLEHFLTRSTMYLVHFYVSRFKRFFEIPAERQNKVGHAQ